MVSIILPTYNRKYLITKAIDSVLSQSCQDFELIIVDDCSTDGTESFLRENGLDERVRYIRNRCNLGAAGSRNRGMELAQGEHIAFIDSDTQWHPEKLAKQLELLNRHPEAGMVYSAFYKTAASTKILFPFEEIAREKLSGDIFELLLQMPLVDTPTMLIPRLVLEKTGFFSEELRAFEDYELSLRIAKRYPVFLQEEPLVLSEYTPGCVSEDDAACLESRFFILREFKEDYIRFGIYESVLENMVRKSEEKHQTLQYALLLKKYLL